MKLIIQIPCLNEETALPAALRDLPRSLPGVDQLEWLVIDDGSSDRTSEVARANGVHHVIRHPTNRGLAKAFVTGIEACIAHGADIIVNTDADNQYCAADIPKLIEPLLNHRADIVIGARPIATIRHFSPLKKLLQRAGSWVVRRASQTPVQDAPSGFRAFTRNAAMRLNVFDSYTYTLETVIQAGQKGMTVLCVPVRVNPESRPSRLIRSTAGYVARSFLTILRIFMTYRPARFFAMLGAIPFTAGFILSARFLILYLAGSGSGKIQSLILASLLMSLGFMLFVVAMLADLLSVNRQLLEKLDWRVRQLEHPPAPSAPSATRDHADPATRPSATPGE